MSPPGTGASTPVSSSTMGARWTGPRAAGSRPSGRQQGLDYVALLDELLGRLADPILGVAVVLQIGHDLPGPTVRAHREAELKPFRDPVLAVTDHRHRVPLAPRRWIPDAVDRIEHGVGRRGCRGRPPGLDHGRSALLHGLDELALQPAVVLDHIEGRKAGDIGVASVGVLRGRVVAPDAQVPYDPDRYAGLPGQQRLGAVLVQPGHGKPALREYLGSVGSGDQAVGVARVTDDEDANVARGRGCDRLALRSEDAGVDGQQVAPLHALFARHGTHEQDPRRA